ncbi:hypothetical protein BDN70DRAFT_148118 [Pholiota conissans]|uniref:Uncharacterized protein n=1 Tax=Pholiota conissans TaxID=109636 RepID=A0A9P5YX76_9AGAR|nr:hypothetical protein BDN70DRAFT_148118 [Pholiota conissans]
MSSPWSMVTPLHPSFVYRPMGWSHLRQTSSSDVLYEIDIVTAYGVRGLRAQSHVCDFVLSVVFSVYWKCDELRQRRMAREQYSGYKLYRVCIGGYWDYRGGR